MMLKKLTALLPAIMLAACSTTPQADAVGGTPDKNGCLPSAGQSYSYLKQQCIQPFDVADITLADPDSHTLAVYVILSKNKSQAEVFAADLPENTILKRVKGGYVSKDKKVRLTKTKGTWQITKSFAKY